MFSLLVGENLFSELFEMKPFSSLSARDVVLRPLKTTDVIIFYIFLTFLVLGWSDKDSELNEGGIFPE
jgi:hypothetical protein